MTTAPGSETQSSRRRLGRGLTSLLSTPVRVDVPSRPAPAPAVVASSTQRAAANDQAALQASIVASVSVEHQVLSVEIDLIAANPKQPRQHFDEAALKSLANSISTSGLMQPIVVRQHAGAMLNPASVRYQIIAGERRWRAAQLAGLKRIPVIVRNVDDRTGAELSLVENLQREDLNPMERADAFRRLLEDFNLTHQDIAQRVGLDRSSVSNHLRLLELDESTREALRDGSLSMGHAKVLLALTNIPRRASMATQCLRQGWSVRELERRIKTAGDHQSANQQVQDKSKVASPASANAADLERRLAEHLGTKVHLKPGRNKGSGRLVIEFYNLDQFEGLLRRIRFEAD